MTIALISYGNIQKNGRDARRKSDISTIQSALEQYHADQGYYPLTLGTTLVDPGGAKVYMSKVPQEIPPGTYFYAKYPGSCTDNDNDPNTYCTNYCLFANVENESNAVLASDPPCASASAQYQVSAP